MVETLGPTKGRRSKLAAFSQVYADLLAEFDLSEEQIDSAIEELRPVRMWFYADNYGDAPGFRRDPEALREKARMPQPVVVDE
jgi:hypothetical protein